MSMQINLKSICVAVLSAFDIVRFEGAGRTAANDKSERGT